MSRDRTGPTPGVLMILAGGLALAFALNVPMRALETHLFARMKAKGVRGARAARMLSFVLTLVLVLAMASTTSWAKPNKSNEFKDIKGNYSYQSILKLQELGILSGYPDGTFRPKQPLKGA